MLSIGDDLHDGYADHCYLYYSRVIQLSRNNHGQYYHLYYRVHYPGDDLYDLIRLSSHVSYFTSPKGSAQHADSTSFMLVPHSPDLSKTLSCHSSGVHFKREMFIFDIC